MWMVDRFRHLARIGRGGWTVLALIVWATLLPALSLLDLGVIHYGSPQFQATWAVWWYPHWSWHTLADWGSGPRLSRACFINTCAG